LTGVTDKYSQTILTRQLLLPLIEITAVLPNLFRLAASYRREI